MIARLTLTAVLWAGILAAAVAQQLPPFDHYRAPKHLPADIVTTLLHDSYNRMWIGTSGGPALLKDGRFIIFKSKVENQASISDSSIHSFAEDGAGRVWIGTDDGINLYDSLRSSFYRFMEDPFTPGTLSNKKAWVVYCDSKGTLWVGTERGLNRRQLTDDAGNYRLGDDLPQDGFRVYAPDDSASNYPAYTTWAVLETRDGRLWFGTAEGGLALYQPETDDFRVFRATDDRDDDLSDNYVWTLYEDKNGNLWIGTENGVSILTAEERRNETYKFLHADPDPDDEHALSHPVVRKIDGDSAGNLWFATDSMLCMLTAERAAALDFTFERFEKDDESAGGLSSNAITTVYVDQNNKLWVGTWGDGLNVQAGKVDFGSEPAGDMSINLDFSSEEWLYGTIIGLVALIGLLAFFFYRNNKKLIRKLREQDNDDDKRSDS